MFPDFLISYHVLRDILNWKRCKEWLRTNAPEHFPDLFPDECAARLEAIRLAEESGGPVAVPKVAEEEEEGVKVAKPIEQKTSGGKKKKAAAEVVLMLGQRKGKKQVTIVYGLDLFGIKLKDATKAAKKKFATGSNLAIVRICCGRDDALSGGIISIYLGHLTHCFSRQLLVCG